MTSYPTALPITEIRNVIASVKAGTIGSNRAQVVKDLWVCQGYLQGRVIGEPNASGKMMAAAEATRGPAEMPTDEDAVNMLQLVVAAEEHEGEEKADHKMLAFNWASLLIWVVKKSLPLVIGV